MHQHLDLVPQGRSTVGRDDVNQDETDAWIDDSLNLLRGRLRPAHRGRSEAAGLWRSSESWREPVEDVSVDTSP